MNQTLNFCPVRFGPSIRYLYGGPYRKKPEGMKGVKMAAEINAQCDVSVPTRDYCVPDPKELEQGIRKTILMLAKGEKVYVGCMGGVGRTGLFMAVLLKAMGVKDPIKMVRECYSPHAVETEEQEAFVRDFDTRRLKLTALGAKILSLFYWK